MSELQKVVRGILKTLYSGSGPIARLGAVGVTHELPTWRAVLLQNEPTVSLQSGLRGYLS